jgi:hypothetical protein
MPNWVSKNNGAGARELRFRARLMARRRSQSDLGHAHKRLVATHLPISRLNQAREPLPAFRINRVRVL